MDKAASASKDAISSTPHSFDRVMNKVLEKVDKASSKAAPVMVAPTCLKRLSDSGRTSI